MEVNQALDSELSGGTIAPGQSLSGWAFFAFPSAFSGLDENSSDVRITISDFLGHSQTLDIKGQTSRKPDDIPGGHNVIQFGKPMKGVIYNLGTYPEITKR